MRDKIEKWYKQGLWTPEMVLNAIGRVLTRSEAYEIINSKEVIK